MQIRLGEGEYEVTFVLSPRGEIRVISTAKHGGGGTFIPPPVFKRLLRQAYAILRDREKRRQEHAAPKEPEQLLLFGP